MTGKILTGSAREPYDEQLSVLVTHSTRAFLLGLAIEDARGAGRTSYREGEAVRNAIAEGVAVLRKALGRPEADRITEIGRRELIARRTVDPNAPATA